MHGDHLAGLKKARFTYTSEATSLVTESEFRISKNNDENKLDFKGPLSVGQEDDTH